MLVSASEPLPESKDSPLQFLDRASARITCMDSDLRAVAFATGNRIMANITPLPWLTNSSEILLRDDGSRSAPQLGGGIAVMVKEYGRILEGMVWSSDRMDLDVKVLPQIDYVHQRGSAGIRGRTRASCAKCW
jgi:hypothetical protein